MVHFNLSTFFKEHPSLRFADDMRELCQPLAKLGIDYFSHIRIDSDNNFYGNSNHPDYFKYYFEHDFQHVDLHSAKQDILKRYVLWDDLELHGKAENLYHSSRIFQLAYTFSICEQDGSEKNYYNFEAHYSKEYIKNFYFQHVDLLERFVAYYKYSLTMNDRLNRAYQMPCPIMPEQNDLIIKVHHPQQVEEENIHDFLQSIQRAPSLQNSNSLQDIPRRELQCAYCLVEGMTAKEMAQVLNISGRTVESYINRLKRRFNANNSIHLVRSLIEAGLLHVHQQF